MEKTMASSGKRARKSTKTLWAVLIILVLAAGAAWYFLAGSSILQKASAATPGVKLTAVKRGSLVVSAAGTGALAAGKTATLSFSTAGIVTEVNVQAGDTVTAGQVLAKQGSTGSLEAAVASATLKQLQAQQALAALQKDPQMALAQAFQKMINAQQTYNTALLADQRTAYARCSQEVATRNRAALDNATNKLQEIGLRYYGSDAWIEARNKYDTALANYNSCISYTADEKTNAGASLQVATVALQQAKDDYAALKDNNGIDPDAMAAAQVALTAADAQLAQAQDNLAGATLIAPFAGKVVSLAGASGSMADTSTFITLADMSTLRVTVSIDEADLDKLALGNSATVSFNAVPEQTFHGKVVQVNPSTSTFGQFRAVTGVIELDAAAVKALQTVPLGVSASVTVIQSEVKDVLLIPIAALKSSDQGYTVMVKGSDGNLVSRPVEVGLKDDASAVITSGLTEGEMVSSTTSAGSQRARTTQTSGQLQFGGEPFPGGIPPGGLP
jgi:HlyD family secretion protein